MARKYEPNLWLLNRNACLSGGVALSQATNTPWVNISQTDAISTSQAACDDCHLISEAEWMTVAANVLGVASNWSGGTVGSGFIYSGHSDNSPANSLAATTDDNDGYNGTGNTTGSNQRRTLTLTNGEVIWDFPGNVWEWTTGTIAGGQLPGLSGEVAYVYRQWNNGSLLFNGHSRALVVQVQYRERLLVTRRATASVHCGAMSAKLVPAVSSAAAA